MDDCRFFKKWLKSVNKSVWLIGLSLVITLNTCILLIYEKYLSVKILTQIEAKNKSQFQKSCSILRYIIQTNVTVVLAKSQWVVGTFLIHLLVHKKLQVVSLITLQIFIWITTWSLWWIQDLFLLTRHYFVSTPLVTIRTKNAH